MERSRELLPGIEQLQWIESVEELGDVRGPVCATRSHDVIRHWAQACNAQPAEGAEKVNVNDGGSPVRFNFPGFSPLRPITWDQWFETFDRHNLVFLFETADSQAPSPRFRTTQASELERGRPRR